MSMSVKSNNDKIRQFPDRKRSRSQASEWVARMDAGRMSPGDDADLQKWLHADSCHADILMEMASLLDNTTILSELARVYPLNSEVVTVRLDQVPMGSRAPNRVAWVTAAALAIAVLGLGFFNPWEQHPADLEQVQVASTLVGELKILPLADGSQLTLNSRSEVAVNFSATERRVELTRGEALFEVAHDEQRPFLVLVGETVVRAVGTAFNVQLGRGAIEVMVTDGVVEISRGVTSGDGVADSTQPVTRIEAGQFVSIAENIEIEDKVDPVSVDRKLSWQKGMIAFEGETLEQVVEELGRYSDITFVLADAETRAIRVGGYFQTGDIEGLLDVLENGFNINVTRFNSGVVHLSCLEPPPPTAVLPQDPPVSSM